MDELLKKYIKLGAKELYLKSNNPLVYLKENKKIALDQELISREQMIAFIKSILKENIAQFKKQGFFKGEYKLSPFESANYHLVYKNKEFELVFIFNNLKEVSSKEVSSNETELKNKNERNILSKSKISKKNNFTENSLVVLDSQNDRLKIYEDFSKSNNLTLNIISSMDDVIFLIQQKICKRFIFSVEHPSFLELYKPFYDLTFEYRKEIYVLLVSTKFSTASAEVLFTHSADYIINTDDLNKFQELYTLGLEKKQKANLMLESFT